MRHDRDNLTWDLCFLMGLLVGEPNVLLLALLLWLAPHSAITLPHRAALPPESDSA